MQYITEFLLNNFPGISYIIGHNSNVIKANQNAKKIFAKIRGEAEPIKRNANIKLNRLEEHKRDHGYCEYNLATDKYRLSYCNLPLNYLDGIEETISLNLDIPNQVDDLKGLGKYLLRRDDIYFNPLSILITDIEGEIIYLNKKVFGKAIKDKLALIGENIRDIERRLEGKYHYPINLRAIEGKKIIKERKYIEFKETHIIKELIAFPLYINHQLVGSLSLGIDNCNLLISKNDFGQEREVEDMSDLAFRIIHELRNPLQEIIALTKLCEIKANDQELVESANNITDGVEEINTLLNKVLNLANVSSFKLEEVSINFILDAIYREKKVVCENLDIELTITGENSSCVIDKNLFLKAILNILDNAVDILRCYNKSRKIIVKAYENEEFITFSIYNSGPKIPDSLKDKVFDLFVSQQKVNGKGLGLSISHYIITEIHQGEIWFDSDQDGTIFYIKINRNLEPKSISIKEMPNYKNIQI